MDHRQVPVIAALAKPAQHSVHPTGGSLRVFKQFAWLEAGSVKAARSRPAHQRVTQTVGRLTTIAGKEISMNTKVPSIITNRRKSAPDQFIQANHGRGK